MAIQTNSPPLSDGNHDLMNNTVNHQPEDEEVQAGGVPENVPVLVEELQETTQADPGMEERQNIELDAVPGNLFPPHRSGRGWSAPVQGQYNEMPLLDLVAFSIRRNRAAQPRRQEQNHAPAPAPARPLAQNLGATLNEALAIVAGMENLL